MDWPVYVAFFNALAAASLGFAVLLRENKSLARGAFAFVMYVQAAEAVANGYFLQAHGSEQLAFWLRIGMLSASLLPVAWLLFSLTYSRGNAWEFVKRWQHILLVAFLLPLTLTLVFNDLLLTKYVKPDSQKDWYLGLGVAGVGLQASILLSSALALMNLERTFRTATGTMRWRIKYLVLGCGVILGARIYTSSQAVLFSGSSLSIMQVRLLAGAVGYPLIAFSFLRARLADVDIYPSHVFLQRSLTATLAGAYLIGVGLLSKVAVALGGRDNLPFHALIILVGLVGLAVLLMSDRLRQFSQRVVSRHLQRPIHDYRAIWTTFSARTATLVTREELCREVARLTSETFNVLSVTVFLFDDQNRQLRFGASTSLPENAANEILQSRMNIDFATDLRLQNDPVDLDASKAPWVQSLKRLNPTHFDKGGSRICLPLVASGQLLGLVTLNDRVSGIPFSAEDFELLKCLGSQVAASLLNLKLSESLLRSKELEAFQTMSTFFVHDLKNTALTLSLMLQNLPVHFANPDFREDALKSIGKTVSRINDLISRLSLLRQGLKIKAVDSDLNGLVSTTLAGLKDLPGVQLSQDLQAIAKVRMDPEQIQKVLTNLVLNARDAVSEAGQIHISTAQSNGWASLQVTDNGCGISPDFLGQHLFRPFQTTKKKGIGIGMYHSKMIVEAHSGRIEVDSELGKGTTFRVLLPLAA